MTSPYEPMRPVYEPDESYASDNAVGGGYGGARRGNDSGDDEMSSLSFGALKKAEAQLEDENRSLKLRKRSVREKDVSPMVRKQEKPKREAVVSDSSESEDSSPDEAFFEEEKTFDHQRRSKKSAKKSKHRPAEKSSKKPVSRIRDIPGLSGPKSMNTNLYQDVRFDKSRGRSENFEQVRKNYKFLDDYRQREIEELSSVLGNRKLMNRIDPTEKEDMEAQLRSMKSKLQTLQNRDLERDVLRDYEQKINEGNKSKYHLKQSEKRKVVQKWKFEHMKAKQREKVMERKRKKRLGKEFKQFAFHER
ncbi:LAMI_0A03862g1_1 [Lachancea mirantina]|uniref:rRNA biogenesis protein RRP36 n=1 Tax=Lachancea mirantina TaxID=1230905 RepID=A0A1G4INY8_9SACH|nr:LAMI_0A03862g1_1 [Lachancea mirantina]